MVNFANRFYHDAQVLLGAKAMGDFNKVIALQASTRPYRELHCRMLAAFASDLLNTKKIEYLF